MNPITEKLIHVGPLRESLWVYTFSAACRIFIGMARVLLLTWLIAPATMGLWGTAIMGMVILGPLANLGFNHGLTRFVSVYEAAGKLGWYFRKAFSGAIAITFAACVVILVFRNFFGEVLYPQSIGYVSSKGLIVILIIVNVFAMGCYCNMLSLMNGLRVYRLMAAIEVVFSLMFTVILLGAIRFFGSSSDTVIPMMLAIHLFCQIAVFIAGSVLLGMAVKKMSAVKPVTDDLAFDRVFTTVDDFDPLMRQLAKFGTLALLGALAWQLVTFASYYMSFLKFGPAVAGEFNVTLRLSQPLYTLALAAWAVGYAHIAMLKQQGEEGTAEYSLDMLFRLISWPMQLVGAAIFITSPLWIQLLGAKYHVATQYLAGLLMMFTAMGNALLLGTLSKVRGSLLSFVMAAFAGIVFNVALFFNGFFGDTVARCASMSAGAGVWAGSLAVMLFYFARWKMKLSRGSVILLLLPGLYLLPYGQYTAAGLLIIGLAARAFFSGGEMTELVKISKELRHGKTKL